MTLDERINKDLSELYNGGVTPGEIKNAIELDGLIKAKPGQTSFATKALPGYYTGKRDAKTVMVMLNPGMCVCEANCRLMYDIGRYSMNNAADVINYHKWCADYGRKDKSRFDNFDVKQAFFFHKWDKIDIKLPEGLCAFLKSERKTLLEAKEAVLTQKLQLELIPYASSSFIWVDKRMIPKVFPFVETLLNEIFSHERNYVVFCSSKFKDIFERYSRDSNYEGTIDVMKTYSQQIDGSNIQGSCDVVSITYNNKAIKALIANTFPNRALSNAYRLMEEYGVFCYEHYK